MGRVLTKQFARDGLHHFGRFGDVGGGGGHDGGVVKKGVKKNSRLLNATSMAKIQVTYYI